MTYQLTQGNTILRTADNAFIPLDPANIDYQQFLAWKAEGNTPLPAPAPPEPPAQAPLTLEQKLASVGLSLDELKAALTGGTP